MTDNKVSRTIPCNHRVKEYNVFNLQRIAAMTVGEVYDSVSQSGGIVTKKCAACKDLLETLISQVPMCKPSEPMSGDDQNKTAVFIQRWLSHLNTKLAEVSRPVTPVYLRDTVTEILHRMGYDIKCDNAMISWYLGQYKTKVLDPEKITQAIIEHKGTEWANVKPLVKDAEYNIRLTIPSANPGIESQDSQERYEQADGTQVQPVKAKRTYLKGRHQEILAVFEYIESFPSTPGIEQLDEQLRNDLAVVKQVINWRHQATDDYNYREQFQFYLEQLQTLPDNVKEITFATLDDKIRKRLSKGQPAAKTKTKVKQTRKADVTPAKKDEVPQTVTSSMPSHAADSDGMAEHRKDTDASHSDAVTKEEPTSINKIKLMAYLDNLAVYDTEAQRRINEAAADIEEFSRFSDFNSQFDNLKTSVASSSSPFKGGYAVGFIHNKVENQRKKATL